MLSSLISPFRSDLAIYITGENILIGTHKKLLSKQSTCVVVHAATRRVLAVGNEAYEMKGKEPANIEVVQPYKCGCIHDFDIAEAAFRYLIKKYTPKKLIPPRVVVCGQMNSTTAKRALKDALTHAGAGEVLLLETAMASAIGIGLQIEEPTFHIMMNIEYDWMEISVISLAGVAARGSEPIGFKNLLQDIRLYATEALSLSPNLDSLLVRLRTNGFDRDTPLLGWEAWIDSVENGKQATTDLNAEAMSKACTPTLLRIREAFKEMMEQLPKEKRMLVGNATVHLTGEYSNIPGVPEMLSRCIHQSVKVSPNSTEAAYHGTTKILSELNDLMPYVSTKR